MSTQSMQAAAPKCQAGSSHPKADSHPGNLLARGFASKEDGKQGVTLNPKPMTKWHGAKMANRHPTRRLCRGGCWCITNHRTTLTWNP